MLISVSRLELADRSAPYYPLGEWLTYELEGCLVFQHSGPDLRVDSTSVTFFLQGLDAACRSLAAGEAARLSLLDMPGFIDLEPSNGEVHVEGGAGLAAISVTTDLSSLIQIRDRMVGEVDEHLAARATSTSHRLARIGFSRMFSPYPAGIEGPISDSREPI